MVDASLRMAIVNLFRKLRDEIYAPGDSRDVNLSIERFLGRPRSLAPFLKELGLAVPAAP